MPPFRNDAAWKVVLELAGEARRPDVVSAMEQALTAWLAYRDEVTAACGVAPRS